MNDLGMWPVMALNIVYCSFVLLYEIWEQGWRIPLVVVLYIYRESGSLPPGNCPLRKLFN